jgi:hypothetical protein
MKSVLYIASRQGGPNAGFWSPVGRLEHEAGAYRFVYTKGAEMLQGFEPFPGMPDLRGVYESEVLFPLFANRMLSPSRPEYEAFLMWGGFDPANPPDPLAVLGLTQGLRQTDSLEVFPCPMPDQHGRYLSKFFLHGVRWMHPAAHERIGQLKPGEKLGLSMEVGNEHDADAVSVRTRDTVGRLLIGYVPRYLAKDVRELCGACHPDLIEVTVERLNAGAPLQQRVLCRLSSCWPESFTPCGGDPFQAIAETPAATGRVGRLGGIRG